MKHDRKAWKKGPAQKAPVDSWQLEQPSAEPGARAGGEWDHLGVWQGRFPCHGRPGVGSVGMPYNALALALAFMFVMKVLDDLELIWTSTIVSDHAHKFHWFPAPIAGDSGWLVWILLGNQQPSSLYKSGDLGLDNLNPNQGNQAMSFVDSSFPKKSSPLTLCSEFHLTAGLNNEHATDKMDEMWAVSVWCPASPNSYPWFQKINSAGSWSSISARSEGGWVDRFWLQTARPKTGGCWRL